MLMISLVEIIYAGEADSNLGSRPCHSVYICMAYYRPPTRAQKQEDLLLQMRKQIAAEVRAANPSSPTEEIERLVVHRLQHGPPPAKPGIPREVLEGRRKERQATVARGKSGRLGG